MKYDCATSAKRTKIVATLGPASSNKATFQAMVGAGVNAVRLNFSHGDHQSHAQTIAMVREVSEAMNRPIPIIGDLRGPRIRVGEIEGGKVMLVEGQSITLTPEKCLGTAKCVSVTYPKLARDLHAGARLLIDDGSIHLRVTRLTADDCIEGIIEHGGTLSSNRGINVPGLNLSIPPLTQKDLEDIDFAVAHDLEYLALSFVQCAGDIQTLKTILAAKNSDIAVIAKIEMSGAVEDIDAVVAETDAVMVARGDLALEMSFKEVPIVQKRIIATCRAKAVPVITATQMLESMINAAKPTRAEVTDVANAIFDGTDALMLSGETAIGKYPEEVIATMTRIAVRAEEAWCKGEVPHLPELQLQSTVGQIISYSSAMTADHLKAAAIVSYTRSGGTARRISRFRPLSPILALTPNVKVCNQLGLVWGIQPILIDLLDNTEVMTRTAVDCVVTLGLAQANEHVVITSGNPSGPPGNTNLISVEKVMT